jgi:hypothetical protein
MLVSLFSGMAFADDDVIVEEPVAEEVAEEPVVEEASFEAADAFAEEYTEEGSFEAADIQTFFDFLADLTKAGWKIERMDPAEPKCGTIVKVWVHDGTQSVATPREVLFDHVWADPFNPEVAAVMKRDDPDAIIPGVTAEGQESNGWKLVSSTSTSCVEGMTLVYQRVCMIDEKHVETQTVTVPGGEHVWATDPFTYAYYNGFDDDATPTDIRHVDNPANIEKAYDEDAKETTPEDIRAILVMPTATKDGLGHEVCRICGTLNPNTADYVIPAHTESDTPEDDFHLYSEWREKVPATCSADGYEEKVCNIPGCQGSKNRPIAAWNHHDPDSKEDLMEFTGVVERVSCFQYVEVWECTNPLCCTEVVKDPDTGKYVEKPTYPEASQYVEYRGKANDSGEWVIDENAWYTLADAKKAAEAASPTDLIDARNQAYEDAIDALKTDKNLDKFNEAIKEADTAYETGVASKAAADKVFFWFTDTKTGHATENYEHHKYETDYTAVLAPGCCTPGVNKRSCSDCGLDFVATVPALEPIFGTKVFMATYTDINGNENDYHYVKCTRPECVAEEQSDPDFLKPELATLTDLFPTDDDNLNPQTKIVDHDWSDWIVELPPEGTNRGHWYRTCMYKACRAHEDFFGTQEEFDEKVNPPHPVLKTGIYNDEGVWKLFDMGLFDEDFTGIYDGYCQGYIGKGRWYVVDGLWMNETNGATLVGDTWYFLAGGKVQEVTQLAEYQDEWFLVEDGVIDTTKSALVEYNGGKFVVAAGRIVSEYDGLWQNAKSIGGNDEWYYVADGKVQTDYTGLVQYDGEWFYVENGELVPYNGQVEYDGGIFNVRDGMVVSQVA